MGKIKKFDEMSDDENITEKADSDILGIISKKDGRKMHTNPNRRTQYFYDYYTGKKITGKSKYELNKQVFDLARSDDEIGILAQFCLQIERDSMTGDYTITDKRDEDHPKKDSNDSGE